MAEKTDHIFEETSDIPAGRKAREVSKVVWNALAESAKRNIAFKRTAEADVITELRKDLTSAAVRAKYDVTTGTTQLEDGKHRLTFAAKVKTGSPSTNQ